MNEIEPTKGEKNDLNRNDIEIRSTHEMWKDHINSLLIENLEEAVKQYNSEEQEIGIKVKDMISIDRIEDEVVTGELLDGSMVDIPLSNFSYDITAGDIINVNLTYEKGEIANIEVLDKNEEEKTLRLKMVQETLRRMRQ